MWSIIGVYCMGGFEWSLLIFCMTNCSITKSFFYSAAICWRPQFMHILRCVLKDISVRSVCYREKVGFYQWKELLSVGPKLNVCSPELFWLQASSTQISALGYHVVTSGKWNTWLHRTSFTVLVTCIRVYSKISPDVLGSGFVMQTYSNLDMDNICYCGLVCVHLCMLVCVLCVCVCCSVCASVYVH